MQMHKPLRHYITFPPLILISEQISGFLVFFATQQIYVILTDLCGEIKWQSKGLAAALSIITIFVARTSKEREQGCNNNWFCQVNN